MTAAFTCERCKAVALKWSLKCSGCGAWQSMTSDRHARIAGTAIGHARGRGPIALGDVRAAELERFSLGLPGLDRVLGGGGVRGGAVLISGDPGCGKAQPYTAKILTPSGWRRMGDLRVGDEVIDDTGHPSKILSIHEQGVQPVFRVILNDGGTTECTDDHLWLTRTNADRIRSRVGKVKTLQEIRKSPRRSDGGRNHSIPVAKTAHFQTCNALPLDPWLLGAYLGDGCLEQSSFCNPERDVQEKFEALLPFGDELIPRGNGLHFRIRRKNRPVANAGRKGFAPSMTREILRNLGLLHAKSWSKFIPPTYLYASAPSRLALLQGLCDTDGTVIHDGRNIEFCTASRELSEGVAFLVGSLGGVSTSTLRATRYLKDGKHFECRPSYRMLLRFPLGDLVPVSSKKHLAKYRVGTGRITERFIDRVEPAGSAPCRCIRIDAPSSLYVTDDFIVTHNSTMLMQSLSAVAKGGQRALYVSGEENEEQIKDRAERLGGISPEILLLTEKDLDTILEIVENARPACLVVDSAQVIAAAGVDGLAGGVTQVRHCTSMLVEQCKRLRTCLLLVCHVTKDGGLAGPKTLEHLVDAVLSLERGGGESRVLTCPEKNRLGATSVRALFEMDEHGLRGVDHRAPAP